MSIKYHCTHLSTPSAPAPPSYASSSTSFYPLDQLYFCEECDAVRCDLCSVTEIASYFCPNCTFDVPSANVRGDKNRCARSCFSCPGCTTPLQVHATGLTDEAGPSAPSGPPFLLVCPCCRWSSREVGLEFEKSAGLALQIQKLQSAKDNSQPEFEALKDHLNAYITSPVPVPTPARPSRVRQPSRHISQLTQMASKALHRDVPGMAAAGAATKSGLRREVKPGGEKYGWDEIEEYSVKESWRARGLQRGDEGVERMRRLAGLPTGSERESDRSSWYEGKAMKYPERIPLQTKLTKRCPHPACRHLLIQPDTKSTRFKIKMVASSYLPLVEIGRRRRIVGGPSGSSQATLTVEDAENRRRDRRKLRARGEEVDEDMGTPLLSGEVYTYQIAFTNPLYDPIQVRLTQPTSILPPLVSETHVIHIATPHFVVNPLRDAWAYDEEDEYPEMDGTEFGTSEDGSSALPSSRGTLGAGKRSRLSVLNTGSGGGLRDKDRRKKESDIEKKGNCSRVGIEVEILPTATGNVIFDLEIRYTYRFEEAPEDKPKEGNKESTKTKIKEEYKHFTFWTRVDLGRIDA